MPGGTSQTQLTVRAAVVRQIYARQTALLTYDAPTADERADCLAKVRFMAHCHESGEAGVFSHHL